MAQRDKRERALGPYPARRQWRIVVVGTGGARTSHFYPTEEEARAVVKAINKEAQRSGVTVSKAREEYERYLIAKGNKPKSISATIYRLGQFFREDWVEVDSISKAKCASLYEDLRTRANRAKRSFAVDSHRNFLAETKTFLNWCAARGWLKANPLSEVKGLGKRRHGKEQLRIDEARKWFAVALARAKTGDTGAVAALTTLLMGMRANEIVSRIVRDLDDEGRILWITDSKTEAGKRTLEVPDLLRPLLQQLAEGKGSLDRLFGQHWRDWVRKTIRSICKAAKVPMVSAHGMRGLHSTLALANGVSGHAVAASLGHESETTTYQSYAKPEAVAAARQNRTLSVLEGGRSAA